MCRTQNNHFELLHKCSCHEKNWYRAGLLISFSDSTCLFILSFVYYTWHHWLDLQVKPQTFGESSWIVIVFWYLHWIYRVGVNILVGSIYSICFLGVVCNAGNLTISKQPNYSFFIRKIYFASITERFFSLKIYLIL